MENTVRFVVVVGQAILPSNESALVLYHELKHECHNKGKQLKEDHNKMNGISGLVKDTLPNYLSSLPIPDSFTGWFKLSFKDWLALIPPTAVVAGLGYTVYLAYCPAAKGGCSKAGRCNQSVRKHEAKVVDMVDIENIAEKAAFCRCWKSKNWPYCDGSHGEHNKQTGDNVGPVVVKRNT